VNFDAKVRRESFEPIDLFHAHIGGMDAFALGLKLAAKIRKDGALRDFVKQRYASWDDGIGKQVEAGQTDFEKLEAYMLEKGDATPNVSGGRNAGESDQSIFVLDAPSCCRYHAVVFPIPWSKLYLG